MNGGTDASEGSTSGIRSVGDQASGGKGGEFADDVVTRNGLVQDLQDAILNIITR